VGIFGDVSHNVGHTESMVGCDVNSERTENNVSCRWLMGLLDRRM